MQPLRFIKVFSIGAFFTIISAFTPAPQPGAVMFKIHLPYAKAGLTRQQAAAHLLNRFSFGATPGELDAVVSMGLENWLQEQLQASLPDEELNKRMANGYDALAMSNAQIVNTYVRPDQALQIGVARKLIRRDSIMVAANTAEYRMIVRTLMDSASLKPVIELHRQLINQKVLCAAYSNNQLKEVLTDFWFNHFNVSLTKNQSQQFVLTYERDAIRPNVLGRFSNLLEATAKHPAMLEYLDNASSVSNDNSVANPRLKAQKKNEGLNENYAREIMELHTMGVDGGYTQKDVTEVARALTGWTLYPNSEYGAGSAQRKMLERVGLNTLQQRGFVIQGDFLYRADKHDQGEKNILGHVFPAGGGYEEGMRVIELLSIHPATAAFICKKLATRFVSDTPSVDLVRKMTAVFMKSKGDIRQVLIAMVEQVDFWKPALTHEKIKSPFELVISAIRATHADVQDPFQVFNWCARMGQRFYYYQAPTGFPDNAAFWINTGSLLNRMNFGLAFATQKIPGIRMNWAQLNNNHEPESVEQALTVFSNILLPERNQEQNIKRLLPLVKDVRIGAKIAAAADKAPPPVKDETNMAEDRPLKKQERKALAKNSRKPLQMPYTAGINSPVAQVAGIIIGSPEFQRK
ncbi:MAG: DUF1800 domain-containing protein [Sediminibacterium sp.]|nr:DUF1800 domain-containing protein [Sediminibacterium sp.]